AVLVQQGLHVFRRVVKVTRELHLFVARRRHFRDRAFKILGHLGPHGVQLQSHLLDLVLRSQQPLRTRRQRSCSNRRLDKGSAFHGMFSLLLGGRREYTKSEGGADEKSAALVISVSR